jgi:ATP-dependent DNA helicase RecQ
MDELLFIVVTVTLAIIFLHFAYDFFELNDGYDNYNEHRNSHAHKINKNITYNSTPSKNVETLSKFKYKSNISVYKIYSYAIYYPKRFTTAPPSIENERQLLYDFKEGKPTKMCSIISECLISEFANTKWLNKETLICFIPASTKNASILRLKNFSECVVTETNISNGYDVICRIKDREKLNKIGRNYDRNIGLIYDKKRVIGKNIILFDDVITKGCSFLSVANELIKLGASDVIGVFIAQTYHKVKFGKPSWK